MAGGDRRSRPLAGSAASRGERLRGSQRAHRPSFEIARLDSHSTAAVTLEAELETLKAKLGDAARRRVDLAAELRGRLAV